MTDLDPPGLAASTVHQWPRDEWDARLEALVPAGALSWVSVRASGANRLSTVLPWRSVVSLRYDPEADQVEVATQTGVHRIAGPLALIALGDGATVHRVVVVRFDGGLDLIDVVPASETSPE